MLLEQGSDPENFTSVLATATSNLNVEFEVAKGSLSNPIEETCERASSRAQSYRRVVSALASRDISAFEKLQPDLRNLTVVKSQKVWLDLDVAEFMSVREGIDTDHMREERDNLRNNNATIILAPSRKSVLDASRACETATEPHAWWASATHATDGNSSLKSPTPLAKEPLIANEAIMANLKQEEQQASNDASLASIQNERIRQSELAYLYNPHPISDACVLAQMAASSSGDAKAMRLTDDPYYCQNGHYERDQAAKKQASDAGATSTAQPGAAASGPSAEPITRTHTLPPYPPVSAQLGEQGITTLDIQIDANGDCASATVKASSGSDRLDQAAADFVKARWKWRPMPVLGDR